MNSSDWLSAYGIAPYDDLILALDDALEDQRKMCAKDSEDFVIANTGLTWSMIHRGVADACLNAVEKSDE